MGGFMRWGLVVGTLFGIRVKIHWTCFIALAYYFRAIMPSGVRPFDLWIIAIYAGTILLHELGHCFAARSNGGRAEEIVLWPLGGLAFTTGGKNTARDWVWVSMAGPLMHLPISMVCVTILRLGGYQVSLEDFNPLGDWATLPVSMVMSLTYLAFKLQVILFCLNMLPLYPLDGGHILLGLLMGRMGFARAAATTGVLGMLGGVALMAAGLGFIAIWVLLEGWNLYHSSQSMGPPVSTRVHRRLDDNAALPRPATPDEYLRPCPHCQKPIHQKAERCSYCDRLID